MKNILFILACFFIASCSAPEPEKTFKELKPEDFATFDIEKKKAKLAEFKNEFKSLELKLKQFEKVLLKEDPNFTGKREKKAKLVTTTPVRRKDHRTFFEVTGSTESIDDLTLSAEMGGQIMELGLTENQYVNRGDLILRLDNEANKKQLNELYTQLSFAQTMYEKRQNLWNQNIGSEIEYIQAGTNVQALQNKIDAINASFDKFVQYAPSSGLVEKLHVHQGEVVGPGSPLAKVIDFSRLKIKAEINEKYLKKTRKGDLAKISIPTSNFSKVIPINEIGTRINPANNSFTIEFEIDNYDLAIKPNSLVYVEMVDEFIPRAVLIPTNLVQDDFDGSYVYIVNNSSGKLMAEKRYIKLAQTFDDNAIVSQGLKGNELLIDKGFNDVVEEQPVTVSK